jgi:hypothetical protein
MLLVYSPEVGKEKSGVSTTSTVPWFHKTTKSQLTKRGVMKRNQ